MVDEFSDNSQSSTLVDIQRYLQLAWHWAWLIAVTGLIAGGAAYLISKHITPTYQATTRLLVSQPPSTIYQGMDAGAIISSSNVTQTYSAMLKDLPVLQTVIDKLQIKIDPMILKKAIGVSIITNTELIQVTVNDANPNRAAAIANTLGGVFSERIQSLQSARYTLSEGNLNKQILDMEVQLETVSNQLVAATDAAEKDRLETQQTQYRQIYSSLVTSYEQVRLAEAQTSVSVTQVEPASVPIRPISPRPLLNTILAVIIGMFATLGLVFTFDILDDTVRNPEELSRQLSLPILGVIPHHTMQDDIPITQAEPRSPVSEAFRALRTNVEYANASQKLHRLIVTSPLPEDGKTTVISNLAVVIAQRGLRTVLIDCDMRRPRAHNALGLQNRNGLSNLFLQTEVNLDRHVQPSQTKNLNLISSGPLPPNPAELLGSQRMTEILEKLGEQNDMILIDTPPALTVTDAAVLSPIVDGILIVVKAGQTKTTAAKRMVAGLRQVGARLIGIVVNDIKFTSSGYSYYYHSYYYRNANYYSTEQKSHNKKKQIPPKEVPEESN